MSGRLRILHAIHDFLPRHEAGSEIYAFNLCRELASRHVVHVLAAEYDPGRQHGTLSWRVHEGLPVIEIVNNWDVASFSDTWRSPRLGDQLGRVLRATQPDLLHLHSLLNLSFDLPLMARAQGVPVVATLHDHTLVCPAGGQRLHLLDSTVCNTIDPARCAACFGHSAFQAQMTVAAIGRRAGPARRLVGIAARAAAKVVPGLAWRLARGPALRQAARVTPRDIAARLAQLPAVFDAIDLVVAPSAAVALDHQRQGLAADKLLVSDYGFPARPRHDRDRAPRDRVRLGFVGTLVSHKGAHVLLDAARAWPADRFELEIHGSLDTFPDYTAHLRRLADGLPVAFRGRFDPAVAAGIYSRFDLLVVPSLWPENSPLVIHEAFMAGVPVAGARTGGIPELLTSGVNGVLFEPASAASLAEAVRPLIDDPDRLARLASGVPPVKTIRDDARDWQERYEAVIARRAR